MPVPGVKIQGPDKEKGCLCLTGSGGALQAPASGHPVCFWLKSILEPDALANALHRNNSERLALVEACFCLPCFAKEFVQNGLYSWGGVRAFCFVFRI